MRHGRPMYSKQLRKRLLRQRHEVTVNSIVDVEQPPAKRATLRRRQKQRNYSRVSFRTWVS
jgi:hypothetical protein